MAGRKVSRDMALAELARCFGEERVPQLVLALASEIWIFRHSYVEPDGRGESAVDSLHLTEVGALIEACEALLKSTSDEFTLDEIFELAGDFDVGGVNEARKEIKSAIDARDIKRMRLIIDHYNDLVRDFNQNIDLELVPGFDYDVSKKTVKP